jgi:hypothetical protein
MEHGHQQELPEILTWRDGDTAQVRGVRLALGGPPTGLPDPKDRLPLRDSDIAMPAHPPLAATIIQRDGEQRNSQFHSRSGETGQLGTGSPDIQNDAGTWTIEKLPFPREAAPRSATR